MLLNQNGKKLLKQLLDKYYLNGQFHFEEKDDERLFNQKLNKLILKYRNNNYDADTLMKKLLEAYCHILNYQEVEYDNLEKELVDCLKEISTNDSNNLLDILIYNQHQSYSDILDYTLDEEEEYNVLWRY